MTGRGRFVLLVDQAVEAVPQSTDPAGMHLHYRDLAAFYRFKGFIPGAVGNFVSENQQGIDMFQFGIKVMSGTSENFEFNPQLGGCGFVLLV